MFSTVSVNRLCSAVDYPLPPVLFDVVDPALLNE